MSSQSPAVHSVHFYAEHSSLISRLCGISVSALNSGGSVLIVATGPHRDQLVKALNDNGVKVRDLARDGRFTMLDARETLASFMREGHPDSDLFALTIGSILQHARRAIRSKEMTVTVFGEMVTLLWEDGNKDAALELEKLWNNALQEQVFHLHCAYPRSNLTHSSDGMSDICRAHSHVLVA